MHPERRRKSLACGEEAGAFGSRHASTSGREVGVPAVFPPCVGRLYMFAQGAMFSGHSFVPLSLEEAANVLLPSSSFLRGVG